MTKRNYDEFLADDTAEPIIKFKDHGCIDGRTSHDFGIAGNVCKYCGYVATYQEKKKTTTTAKSPGRPRKTPTRTTPTTPTPAMTLKDAREGMGFVLLLAQKLLIMRVPALEPDELNPVERQLLAAALTEELYESVQVRNFLAKLSQQKKHAKLSMVLMVILLPRLKRHGIIPGEMDLEEITGELVNQSTRQSQADSSGGPDRSASEGRENSWDTVPVAAGGSPIPDRGNGVGEVYPGGVAAETTPLRGDSENENGRYKVAGGRDSQVPPGDEKQPVGPDRTEAGSKTGGSEAG